jgi:hypothetical protein
MGCRWGERRVRGHSQDASNVCTMVITTSSGQVDAMRVGDGGVLEVGFEECSSVSKLAV